MVDYVAEPVRAKMIPHYDEIRQTAMENGAVAFTISGSGPAMFSFCDSEQKAKNISAAMHEAYSRHYISNTVYTGKIQNKGARVI